MLTCPSCNTSDGVQIEGDTSGQDQWSGRCEPCGHRWTFSDEL